MYYEVTPLVTFSDVAYFGDVTYLPWSEMASSGGTFPGWIGRWQKRARPSSLALSLELGSQCEIDGGNGAGGGSGSSGGGNDQSGGDEDADGMMTRVINIYGEDVAVLVEERLKCYLGDVVYLSIECYVEECFAPFVMMPFYITICCGSDTMGMNGGMKPSVMREDSAQSRMLVMEV
ncbi:hypothetical protein Tco_0610686 [Tanacetum coccineum]